MRPADLLPGTLELLILKALAGGAEHGYGIVEHLRTASDEVLSVGESALYPALQRILLRDGPNPNGGPRRTTAGRATTRSRPPAAGSSRLSARNSTGWSAPFSACC